MPGLLRAVGRTAVVAGTATAVVGGVQRHQQSRATEAAEAQADQDQQRRAQLQLAAQGALTDAEFTAAKSKLLGLG